MDFTAIGADSDWNMIACGGAHAIARKNNGTIWGWGYNYHGQIGLGYISGIPPGVTPGVTSPTKIGNAADWFTIAGGYSHTLAIKNNRTLWVWGGNWTGQLGIGDYAERWVPTQLGNASDWSIIAGGKDLLLSYSVALKTNKTLWAWGDNSAGQLGLGGDYSDKLAPTQVGTNSDWLLVTASRALTVALKTDSSVWAWGENGYGELGIGDRYSRNTPTQTGTPFPINPPSSLTTSVSSLSEIDLYWVDLSDNETGFKIERKTGRAGTWGEITTIVANQNSWPDTTVSGMNTYYYRIAAFTAVSDSAYSNEVCNAVSGDWSSVSAGWGHALGLKTNYTLWGWGLNTAGQLGLGDNTNRNIPLAVGSDSDWSRVEAGVTNTFAIKTNFTIWSWGYNGNGELGLGDYSMRNLPAQINSDSDWFDVSAGGFHTLALKIDPVISGTLWAWGNNGVGQLGLGDYAPRLIPTQVSTDSDWTKITAGYYHSIALKTNNTIWSWGLNAYGELGLGLGSTNRATPSQIGVASDWDMVTAGNYFSIARKTDGTLWSWGSNVDGQLGLLDNVARNVPTQIGTDSDWSFINAGGVNPALIVHTIAMKTDGTIWGWGDNSYWSLGLGDYVRLRQYPSLIDANANTDWFMGSAGGLYTFWLKSNPSGGGAGGTLWANGYNEYGQLGLGDNGINTGRRNLTLVGE
jgi:alpha-tubulin suppressor-like RCC1 family protein